MKEGATILFANDIQNVNEAVGTQIDTPRHNVHTNLTTTMVEEENRMENQIAKWNENTAEAAGENYFEPATKDQWNSSSHREQTDQVEEDGWSQQWKLLYFFIKALSMTVYAKVL